MSRKAIEWVQYVAEVREDLADINAPDNVDTYSFNLGVNAGLRAIGEIERTILMYKCKHCGDMLSPIVTDCGCRGKLIKASAKCLPAKKAPGKSKLNNAIRPKKR